jgi:ElaB/YqjD/DUF883 family membrane-anchored ribosome-binding protein
MANQRDQSTQTERSNGRDYNPMPHSEDSGDMLNKAKETASNLLDQAKNTAGEAYDKVAEKATSTIEERKAGVTGGLRSVAGSVRQVGQNLNQASDRTPIVDHTARYADKAAAKLEQVAGYFENRDLRAITRDVENYARRNPAVFIGTAFAVGFLAARFLKSSPTPSLTTGQFSTNVDHQLPETTTAKTQSASGSGETM